MGMFVNTSSQDTFAMEVINNDIELAGRDIQRSPMFLGDLSPVLLMITFTSLLFNFFSLTWSAFYRPARSSLLTLLSLADISLIVCGLSLILSIPDDVHLTS